MLLPASQLLNYFLHCAKFCFSQESYYFVELFLGRGGVQCSGICVYFLVVYLLEPSNNYTRYTAFIIEEHPLTISEQLSTRQDNR